jgi:F0F1-type ATP synthase epsilon subunit
MFNCQITSPEKSKLYKSLKSATLPGYFGQVQVLSQHAESFILLSKGDIILTRADDKREVLAIEQGCGYFSNDTLVIILPYEAQKDY